LHLLTITPDTDCFLKEGSLKYNDGTGDHAITGTSFVMPAINVTITAEFTCVDKVEVAPSTFTILKGNSQAFSAEVIGINSPDQAVIWSLSWNISPNTSINSSGVLTVALDETTDTLTVTATSALDKRKSGTAIIKVSNICQVGAVGYATLDDALTAVKANGGGTIKLLTNINYYESIIIDGISVTFDLNGYTLSVKSDIPLNHALKVVNGGKQLLYGDGEFKAVSASDGFGIMADNNSIIEVTNVEAYFGVVANNGSIITVRKDIINRSSSFYYTGAFGAKASGGSIINIGGSILTLNSNEIYMNNPGAIIEGSGSINIAGDVKVTDASIGVKIEGSGSIYVGGDIIQDRSLRPCAEINGSGIIIIDGVCKILEPNNSGKIRINGSDRSGVPGESP